MLRKEAFARRRPIRLRRVLVVLAVLFVPAYLLTMPHHHDGHPLPAGDVTVSASALENPEHARAVAPILARARTIHVVR
jgi:hypothetical protein